MTASDARSPEAVEQMAALVEQRQRANERVSEVEAEAREASEAAQQAAALLADLERRGGPATKRRELGQQLATAKGRAEEPWQVRHQGARLAAGDADQRVREFVAAHLDELVAEREAAGAAKAAEFNAHIEAAVRLYPEVQGIASEISTLAFIVGRVLPGDVSGTHAERLNAEATALLLQGGEAGPRLLHDPRQPRHGAVAETEQPEPAVA